MEDRGWRRKYSFFLSFVRMLIVPRLLKLFEHSPCGQACDRAHSVDDERAVEMVGFVLPDAGDVAFGRFLEGMAGKVLGAHAEFFAAPDFGVDVGEAEAAFFAFLFTLGFSEYGIHVHAGGFLFAGGIHDEEADVFAYLRRGRADAPRALHELDHGGGQSPQARAKIAYNGAGFSQARDWVMSGR